VPNYLGNPDPEVAMGAGLFGAMAIGTLWLAWPLGTLLLGLLVLLTRGRRRLIPAATLARRAGSVPDAGPGP
jgi:Na+-translocating ferredoxin:NAD+ oxidoreductase RnfD subunit